MFELKSENYEEIKRSISKLLFFIEKVDFILFKNKQYKIKFFLGGDFKMLRILYGHKSSNANLGCVWCNCDLSVQPPSISTEWRIHATFGQPTEVLTPIMDFIDYKDCVVDTLHLLLRVSFFSNYNKLLLKCIKFF